MTVPEFLDKLRGAYIKPYTIPPDQDEKDEEGYSVFAMKSTGMAHKLQHEHLLVFLKNRGIPAPELVKLAQALPRGVVVAGGYVRAQLFGTRDFSDIDLFCLNELAFREMVRMILQPGPNPWVWDGYSLSEEQMVKLLEKPETLRYLRFEHATRPSIQLIKSHWFGAAQTVLDMFDITACQFACDSTYLYYNPQGFFDAAMKRIVFWRYETVAAIDYRIAKYEEKGFRISAEQLKAVEDYQESRREEKRSLKEMASQYLGTGTAKLSVDGIDWTPMRVNGDFHIDMNGNHTTRFEQMNREIEQARIGERNAAVFAHQAPPTPPANDLQAQLRNLVAALDAPRWQTPTLDIPHWRMAVTPPTPQPILPDILPT